MPLAQRQLVINVRFNSNHAIPVEAEPSWQIGQVKQVVGERHNVDPNNIRIIFQGRELPDEMQLQESDLCNQSVLHAVRGQRQTMGLQLMASLDAISSLASEGGDSSAQPRQSEASVLRPQFYVYCKTLCNSIKPGRLRVRCATCKLGTITVHRGPNSWQDVLRPGVVLGECQAAKCPGSIAEFYFKCCGHQARSEDDSAAPLSMVTANVRDRPCVVCFSIENPILVFPCAESHVMCLDCFCNYCTVNLNNRAFVYTGCENSLITEGHHFRVLGQEQYDRYQRFATEEYLLQSGGVLCPRPGCGAGLLPPEGDRKVECVATGGYGCGLVFCAVCKDEYHNGDCGHQLSEAAAAGRVRSYLVDPEAARQARWNLKSLTTIEATTKRCPSCRTPTEKNKGCMHMTCRCGFSWCWLCCKQWNRNCQGDHWFA